MTNLTSDAPNGSLNDANHQDPFSLPLDLDHDPISIPPPGKKYRRSDSCPSPSETRNDSVESMWNLDSRTRHNSCPQPLANAADPQNCTYIVIDTNILMEDDGKLEDFMSRAQFNHQKLYVPWKIYQELNKQKGHKEKRAKVKKATQFLTKWQYSSSNRLQTQNGDEEMRMERTFEVKCNDDLILQTCLHLRNKMGRKVKLWTNDILLRLKADTYKIFLFNIEPISEGLQDLHQNERNHG